MNNLMISLKRFMKNKNTITLIGVILIVFIIKVGYDKQIETQVTTNRVPVANVTIQPRTLITKDMIDWIDVPNMLMRDEVIQYQNLIIDKYSDYNTVIPAGSLFYTNTVVDGKDLPDSAFVEVEEGEVVYNFPVDIETTYGNSIFPGNRVDIYMKAENDEGQIMVGKLLENIKIIDVKDSLGKHVFENSEEARRPAVLIFGVEPEINILLRKASYMRDYSVELFPVPHGGSAPATDDLKVGVTSENLKEFINTHTAINDDIDPDLIDENGSDIEPEVETEE